MGVGDPHLRQPQQQLAPARAKQEFLAELGHELKTPLTSLLGAIDHLARTSPAGGARDLLEIARSSADRMKALLNDLLDLER